MVSIIWCLIPLFMFVAFSNIWHALTYVLLACWRWATVVFVAMVGVEPGSSRYSHGVTAANVSHRVSFMFRPVWPYFTPSSVVGRVEALAYNAWIVLLKDTYSSSPLIVSGVLMTNLVTASSIILGFGFQHHWIFRLGRRFLHCPLLETMLVLTVFFGFSVVYYNRIPVQLVLTILIVYRRHMFLTLT